MLPGTITATVMGLLNLSNVCMCVQEFVQDAIKSWVEASDETQEAARALSESKKIISVFSSAVATGTCASFHTLSLCTTSGSQQCKYVRNKSPPCPSSWCCQHAT